MQGADAAAQWDEQTFESLLEHVRTEGAISATGVRISAEELARILEAAPEDPADPGRRCFNGNVDFRRATFTGLARFSRVTFEGIAAFDDAIFEGEAHFRNATFNGPATIEGTGGFQGAAFKAYAWFEHAAFECDARFDGATFGGDANFGFATFRGQARFGGTTFGRSADFYSSRFEDRTFDGETSKSLAEFSGATFGGRAGFSNACFKGSARFNNATFGSERNFAIRVDETLELRGAIFDEPIRLVGSASMLDCSRIQFRRGANLFVRGAAIVLDDADFAEPSMLAPWLRAGQGDDAAIHEGGASAEESAPRLLSMRRAKAANLTIAGIDLRACRFDGARGLDRLRLERVRFAETPSGWQRSKGRRVPVRWTRRLAIAEEHQWRAERAGATGWYGHEIQVPPGLESTPPTPDEIATTYRALRKSREDGKDEPGAADFYYGEMEMRRQGPKVTKRLGDGDPAAEHGNASFARGPVGDAGSRPAPRGERLILWLYWLVSGYGLRGSRALIALALTVVVFAFLFDLWGFQPDRAYGRTLLFSVESTSSLFRAPETQGATLTATGELLQILLRLIGPLFFGLALLSLRGRVKR
jgi:pentapeptide repeat protein